MLAPSKGLKTQKYLSKSLKTSRLRKKYARACWKEPCHKWTCCHTDCDYMRNADVCNSSWKETEIVPGRSGRSSGLHSLYMFPGNQTHIIYLLRTFIVNDCKRTIESPWPFWPLPFSEPLKSASDPNQTGLDYARCAENYALPLRP